MGGSGGKLSLVVGPGSSGTDGGASAGSGSLVFSSGASATGNTGSLLVGSGSSTDGVGGDLSLTVGSGTTGTGGQESAEMYQSAPAQLLSAALAQYASALVLPLRAVEEAARAVLEVQ
ncbi:hypothetical protein JKP88DRAFT_282489 [Tribonema minus]|uniref:Uncharacterized protein n=1 Tax=Tribonema minus TaxID=303371 RepID=A0A836C9K5_9STRA|nr:hypothetical protein JKP88DRAFT_282489 [Tribonema minus]